MARGSEVARLFAGVGQIAGGVEPGKVSRRGALYFVRLACVGMARVGEVARLFAGVGQIAGGVEPGKVSRRR